MSHEVSKTSSGAPISPSSFTASSIPVSQQSAAKFSKNPMQTIAGHENLKAAAEFGGKVAKSFGLGIAGVSAVVALVITAPISGIGIMVGRGLGSAKDMENLKKNNENLNEKELLEKYDKNPNAKEFTNEYMDKGAFLSHLAIKAMSSAFEALGGIWGGPERMTSQEIQQQGELFLETGMKAHKVWLSKPIASRQTDDLKQASIALTNYKQAQATYQQMESTKGASLEEKTSAGQLVEEINTKIKELEKDLRQTEAELHAKSGENAHNTWLANPSDRDAAENALAAYKLARNDFEIMMPSLTSEEKIKAQGQLEKLESTIHQLNVDIYSNNALTYSKTGFEAGTAWLNTSNKDEGEKALKAFELAKKNLIKLRDLLPTSSDEIPKIENNLQSLQSFINTLTEQLSEVSEETSPEGAGSEDIKKAQTKERQAETPVSEKLVPVDKTVSPPLSAKDQNHIESMKTKYAQVDRDFMQPIYSLKQEWERTREVKTGEIILSELEEIKINLQDLIETDKKHFKSNEPKSEIGIQAEQKLAQIAKDESELRPIVKKDEEYEKDLMRINRLVIIQAASKKESFLTKMVQPETQALALQSGNEALALLKQAQKQYKELLEEIQTHFGDKPQVQLNIDINKKLNRVENQIPKLENQLKTAKETYEKPLETNEEAYNLREAGREAQEKWLRSPNPEDLKAAIDAYKNAKTLFTSIKEDPRFKDTASKEITDLDINIRVLSRVQEKQVQAQTKNTSSNPIQQTKLPGRPRYVAPQETLTLVKRLVQDGIDFMRLDLGSDALNKFEEALKKLETIKDDPSVKEAVQELYDKINKYVRAD